VHAGELILSMAISVSLRERIARATHRVAGVNLAPHVEAIARRQWLSREQLEREQLDKLNRLVWSSAVRFTYYRDAISAEAGREFTSLEDFKNRVPILERSTLAAGHLQPGHVPAEGRVYLRKTSGTSGQPRRVYVDASSLSRRLATRFLVFSWHGIRLGEREGRFWGRAEAGKGVSLSEWLLNRERFWLDRDGSVRGSSSRGSPAYFYGYPSLLLRAAENLKQTDRLRPRLIITTAEKLFPHQRAFLQRQFSCPVVEEYGCSETEIIAFECERGRLHIIESECLLEAVPLDGGHEAIITDLSNPYFPLIRYRLGDRVEIGEGPCPCGRVWRWLSSVVGRSSERVARLSNGTHVHGSEFAQIFSGLADAGIVVNRFHVRQVEQDRFAIEVDLPRGGDIEAEVRSRIETLVRAQFGSLLTATVAFRSLGDQPGKKFSYFEPL